MWTPSAPISSGEGGEVVEDEGNSGGAAEREEFFRDAADGGEVVAFGAELEEVGSAVEEGLGDVLGVFLGDVAEVEDAVEAGVVHWSYRSYRTYFIHFTRSSKYLATQPMS